MNALERCSRHAVYIRKNTDSGQFEIVQYYGDKVLMILDEVLEPDCQYNAVEMIREGFRRR